MVRLLLFFIVAISFSQASLSKEGDESGEFVFVGYESEPFYFKSGSDGVSGALYDIMHETCQRLNLRCKFRILNNFREALAMAREGKACAAGPFAFTNPRSTVFHFSPPLFQTRYSFFGTAKAANSIHSYSDLSGHLIGVLYPSSTSISLDRVNELMSGSLKVDHEKSLSSLFQKTDNNSISLAYANTDAGLSWIKRHRSNLQQIPQLGEDVVYYVVFSKKLVDEKHLKDFETQLDDLRKKGFLAGIADKYKLQLFTESAAAP